MIKNEDDTVTIPEAEYTRLLMSEKVLRALESGGVDNWEWYGESLRDAGLYDDEEESYEDIYGDT